MVRPQKPKEYFFISDLHIGGDAALDICDFESELIDFLRELEAKDADTELIIVGDVFGMWELTGVEGIDKLGAITSSHKELFDQFRKTGEKIKITIIPGNHDYELACYPDFVALLAEYNISLEPKEHITRALAGKKIWIEHGNQHDSFNAISDFGNPYVTPLGFYVTRAVVSNTGKYSLFGRGRWLKDLESVSPNEHIPDWMLSNYFYREMSPLLRWVMLPFLLLFSISVVTFVGMLLEKAGVTGTYIFSRSYITSLGIFGRLYWIIFFVNSLIIAFLIIFSIPLALIYRDIMKTLKRYGLKSSAGLDIQKNKDYLDAAREVFERNPEVAVYIFGHTHDAFLERKNGRVIINTGTWLKKLTNIPARFKLLPDIYYPSFRLNYFRISADGEKIVIDYKRLPKKAPTGLTLLQRFVIFGRSRPGETDIPARTVIEA